MIRLANALQIGGLASATVAAFLVSVPLGFLASGVSLVLAGVSLEREVTDAGESDS